MFHMLWKIRYNSQESLAHKQHNLRLESLKGCPHWWEQRKAIAVVSPIALKPLTSWNCLKNTDVEHLY